MDYKTISILANDSIGPMFDPLYLPPRAIFENSPKMVISIVEKTKIVITRLEHILATVSMAKFLKKSILLFLLALNYLQAVVELISSTVFWHQRPSIAKKTQKFITFV